MTTVAPGELLALREALKPLQVAMDAWERWRVEQMVPDYELQRYSAKISVADLLRIRSALSTTGEPKP